MFETIIAHGYCTRFYIFHRYSIAHMSVSDDSSVTLLKTLPTSFCCDNISPMYADTFMVSTNDHERPICSIDVQGNVEDVQHKLLPDKINDICESACTYIPSTNTLVFSYCDQNTLYMCDVMSGDGHVIKSDKIVGPRGVCAGPAGTVFVCSGGTGALVQLSQDGEILMTYDIGMECPYAVSISGDGTRLVVASWADEQNTIKLFHVSRKIAGTFVTAWLLHVYNVCMICLLF